MILITGATGFVGRNLIKKLSKNEKVRCLVRKNIYLGENIEIVNGNLTNTKTLEDATRDISIVIHLASIIKSNKKKEFEKINVEGTKNLIKVCIKNKVKKFIFVSSYDIVTNTLYGQSKALAEHSVKNSGLNYLIFRPTVIYGPDNKKDIDKLINLIKNYPLIPIPGKGEIKLQPLFIEDFINIILQGIKSKKRNKEYFVAGPEPISFNEIIDTISKTLSKKVYKIHIPNIFIFIINKNLLQNKICDITKIKKDFIFNPISFEEGIKKIIKEI